MSYKYPSLLFSYVQQIKKKQTWNNSYIKTYITNNTRSLNLAHAFVRLKV